MLEQGLKVSMKSTRAAAQGVVRGFAAPGRVRGGFRVPPSLQVVRPAPALQKEECGAGKAYSNKN